jgi:hypothetical protein
MKKLIFCILFSTLFLQAGNSQIRGQIIDDSTKKPVPFAGIFYKSSSSGTGSDEKGYFKLQEMPEGMPNCDSLTISCIGYKTKTISVKSVSGNNNSKIFFIPQAIELAEVIVKPRKKIKERIEIENIELLATSSSFIGWKRAIYLKANQPNAKIMSVSVKAWKVCDSASMLLSFYSVKENGTPDKLISKDRMVLRDFKKLRWTKIDLSGYNIFIPENEFFIVFEPVSQLNNCYSEDWKSYYTNKKGEKIWSTSHGEWNVELMCTKEYKNYKAYSKYGNQEWQSHNRFVPLMKVDLEY